MCLKQRLFALLFSVASLALSSFSVAHSTALNLQFYTLPSSEQGIDNHLALLEKNWQEISSPFFLNTQEQGNWIKVSLENNSQQTHRYFLRLSDNELPSAQVYRIDAQGSSALFDQTGLSHRFDNRPIQYRRSIFPIELQPEEQLDLYVILRHQFPVKIQPKVWQEDAFQLFNNQETIFAGMLYGIVLTVIIYSLFVYLTLRDKSYLLFLLFAFFTGVFISMQEGHFYQFIQADKTWPKEAFVGLITALMCFSFTLFSAAFLDLNKRSKLAKNSLNIVGFGLSVFILLLGLNQQQLILSYFTLAVLSALYMTAISIAFYTWRRFNSHSSGFFILAISLANIGVLLDFSTQIPFMPFHWYNYGYASMGYTAMLIMFAFILAYKLRVLQLNEIAASKELLRVNTEKSQQQSLLLQSLSQQKQAEIADKEAHMKSHIKSEFIASMSADIRTPMNSILGLSELLSSTELEPQQRYFVDSLSTSARVLFNTINSLVDYSQIQVGYLAKDIQVFSLSDLIDDCISIFALQANEAKVFFTGLVNPDTPLQYRGYPDQLRQILLNMLSNAIRLEHLYGLSLRAEATGRNTVNSNEICFSVICHGAVLSEEKIQALLTPFDAEEDLSKPANEKGLGLALSLKLAEHLEQDAKISIQTNEDEQTTHFCLSARLWLPNKEQRLELPDYEKLFAGRRMLVCDPHPSFTQSLRILTESWGMKTYAARTSEEVLRFLEEDEAAIELLMIAKDDLSHELLRAIHTYDKQRKQTTAIIAIARTRFELSKTKMQQYGIHALIEKPWTTQQLLSALRTSLDLDNDTESANNQQKLIHALLIEDNDMHLMVLEGLLRKRGLTVSLAENAQQAQAALQNSAVPFDLIFMDCEMAEFDAYQNAKTIRQSEQQSQHKSVIIGFSIHTDDEHREKALQTGMDEFTIKPINPQYIDELVNNFKQGYFHSDDENQFDDTIDPK